jgi:hypothetical protein
MTRQHRRSLPDLRKRCYEILEQGSIGDRASLTVDRLLIGLIIVNLLSVALQSMPEICVSVRHLVQRHRAGVARRLHAGIRTAHLGGGGAQALS